VNEQLQVVPLCLIMVMGPQILTAIFLVTSEKVARNSLAMLLGVGIAGSLGLVIWSGVVGALDVPPKPDGEGPSTTDWVVSGLLALLAIYVWRGRGKASVPKWMTALEEAEPKRAFSLGFLLILLMPTDIIATISAAHVMHDSGSPAIDAWPLVAATVLVMALPFIGYSLLGQRAKRAMPGIREWLTTHAWLVNLVVIVYFIYSLVG
jgi:hypothetical protein